MRCKARQHGRPDCYNAICSILCAGLSVPNITANTSDASVADEDSSEVTMLDMGCTFGHSRGGGLTTTAQDCNCPAWPPMGIASVSILKPTRYCPQASGERPTHSFIVCHNRKPGTWRGRCFLHPQTVHCVTVMSISQRAFNAFAHLSSDVFKLLLVLM